MTVDEQIPARHETGVAGEEALFLVLGDAAVGLADQEAVVAVDGDGRRPDLDRKRHPGMIGARVIRSEGHPARASAGLEPVRRREHVVAAERRRQRQRDGDERGERNVLTTSRRAVPTASAAIRSGCATHQVGRQPERAAGRPSHAVAGPPAAARR